MIRAAGCGAAIAAYPSTIKSALRRVARRPSCRCLSDGVEIDRSRLRDQLPEYAGEFTTPLQHDIYRAISISGPITVASYMRRALMHPTMGYYNCKDAFGTAGDFTTSPEISQLFGEMIGVWLISVLEALGRPNKVSLVELGPGRGTMMSDIIRTMTRLGVIPSVHLIECSALLRQLQADALHSAVQDRGLRVQWHDQLRSFEPAPNEPILVVAQEFLDVLPIHQFQYTELGWRERLVAASLLPNATQPLQVVLAPQQTPACQLIPATHLRSPPRVGDVLEISPESDLVIGWICKHLDANRGAALIVDYGSDQPPAETLRAIQSHQFVPFLERPGRVDVTADVNFGALRTVIRRWQGGVKATCTIEQGRFLQGMGIVDRVEQVVDRCESEHDQDSIIAGYERLVDPEQMGSVYKCMAVASQDIYDSIPGFHSPQKPI